MENSGGSHARWRAWAKGAVVVPFLWAAVIACQFDGGGVVSSGGGELVVRIEVAERGARTLLPAIDMAAASFELTCRGPGGREATQTATEATARFEELQAGTWSVSVAAKNSAGTIIGEGAGEADVEPATESSVTISVTPIAGEGALELTVAWPLEAAAVPGIEGGLTASSGEAVALDFTVDGTQAAASRTGIAAGYYTLQVRLLDGGEPVAGAADVVRIVANETTGGTLDFSNLSGSPGTLVADVGIDLKEPLSVDIAGRQETMELGQSLPLKGWPADVVEGCSASWFVDGFAAAEGASVILGSAFPLGVHRVDLVAFDPNAARAGSSSFLVEVLPSFPPGLLARSVAFEDGSSGIDGLNGCRAVTISDDGRSVYAAGYGDSAIAWFDRDADTGMLDFKGVYKEGADGVTGLAGAATLGLSSDGAYLLAGGFSSGAIAVFSRDASTGALAFIESRSSTEAGLAGLAGLSSVCVSPDDAQVYVAAQNPGSLLVFDFDASNGHLTLAQTLTDEVDGLTLLGGLYDVTITPDGSQALAVANGDNALLVFSRDVADGQLNLNQSFVDGQNGCDGLSGAKRVVLSPGGGSVYVAGYNDNALSVFSREPSSGALAFVGFFKDGTSGVDGLFHAEDIATSSDGTSVYVAAMTDDGVAEFARSPDDGSLTYLGMAGGMDGARGIALSLDGASCYVAASNANTLFLLNRRR